MNGAIAFYSRDDPLQRRSGMIVAEASQLQDRCTIPNGIGRFNFTSGASIIAWAKAGKACTAQYTCLMEGKIQPQRSRYLLLRVKSD
jgi:hypothetical protein